MTTELEKLSAEEITRDIPVGQANLDRMRTEIYDTARILLGIAATRQLLPFGQQVTFSSPKCLWTVSMNRDKKYILQCYEKVPEGEIGFGGIRTAFTVDHRDAKLSLYTVEKVWDDLPTFVAGMIEAFDIREEIRIIMSAAKKKF